MCGIGADRVRTFHVSTCRNFIGEAIGGRGARESRRLDLRGVTETFFAVEVEDMQRAIAFYVSALGATVMFSSAGWSSLRIAGVRVGLALSSEPS